MAMTQLDHDLLTTLNVSDLSAGEERVNSEISQRLWKGFVFQKEMPIRPENTVFKT